MNLHLLCQPGIRDIRHILDAARPYLAVQAKPVVAYLPAASPVYNWLDYTEKAFAGLAEIAYIDTETIPLAGVAAIFDRAGVVYISGGNTFLLNHRLHRSGVFDLLQQRIIDGLPVVGFSAGATICGPTILTSNDMNMCATPYFEGLNVTPFNFSVHYPSDETTRDKWDEWLSEYHVYYDNSVLALEDDAYLRINSHETILAHGGGWLLSKGKERQRIELGAPLSSV
ncbi:MAG: Type 1 glutamine amidotransferase-like domain-containing protein [Chloroflexota bacterium]|jgi:dipeptidase E